MSIIDRTRKSMCQVVYNRQRSKCGHCVNSEKMLAIDWHNLLYSPWLPCLSNVNNLMNDGDDNVIKDDWGALLSLHHPSYL